MEKLFIQGGRKLEGQLDIITAKNAILPILAGSIISNENIILQKISKFTDVINMINILKDLGVKAEFQGDDLILDSSCANNYLIKEEFSRKIRSSLFLLGALLTKFKRAKVAYPGGCNIGNRPIDLHLKGLMSLGVKIEENHGYIICDGSNMHSGDVYLDFASVGATENLIMASVCLDGTTTIYNCAREPEIEDLANFLNSMGCKVFGAGSSIIMIQGVKKITSTTYTPMSDRIIAGTYLIACAMCGGHIKLNNCNKKYNQALIDKLKQAGMIINDSYANIEIISNFRPKSIDIIETQVYPGFPTDLQNQILAMQTIADGNCLIVENLFENRLKVCNELAKMGAKIIVKDRMAIVKGVERLSGATVCASDLRGGASLVLAGLVADGYTTVENVENIDRGYLSIEEDFCKLNAEIKRLDE